MDDRRYSDRGETHADAVSRKMSKLNALRLFRRSSSRTCPLEISPVVNITCRVESPPIVFHGASEETAGAFFSGQLSVEVEEDAIELESLVASLNIHIVYKRPFQSHCDECQHKYIQLESWQLLRETKTLARGTHLFPFSTHLNGSQPTSVDTPIFSISYEFKAEAMAINQAAHATFTNEEPIVMPKPSPIRFELVIPVKRYIPEPIYPNRPLHIFPPTEITAAACYIPTIHPIGTNTLQLKVDGLSSQGQLWTISQVNWKLEENIKATVPACEKHHRGAHIVHDDIRGILRDQARIIGGKEMSEGWGPDEASTDGTLDLEFEFCLRQAAAGGDGGEATAYAFDTKTDDGTEVSHTLLVDLIVTSGASTEDRPPPKTPTGICRRLRMRFNVILTNSSSASVSWDNEAPPIYGDVPISPPEYFTEDRRLA